jgi:hypothetical protein
LVSNAGRNMPEIGVADRALGGSDFSRRIFINTLSIIWLAVQRWNLDASKFGLLVFAGLYLFMIAIRWWWQDIL